MKTSNVSNKQIDRNYNKESINLIYWQRLNIKSSFTRDLYKIRKIMMPLIKEKYSSYSLSGVPKALQQIYYQRLKS